MTGQRKGYAAAFKAKVALEALCGELTTAQLATKRGVRQTVISEWKRQAVAGPASVFSGKRKQRKLPGKARWRSCAPRTGGFWWNGIFRGMPSVDERGPDAGDDRA
jgi:transposase